MPSSSNTSVQNSRGMVIGAEDAVVGPWVRRRMQAMLRLVSERHLSSSCAGNGPSSQEAHTAEEPPCVA